MEWRHEDAPVHGPQVEEALKLEIAVVPLLSPVPRPRGHEVILGPRPELRHVPRDSVAEDDVVDAGGPTRRQRDHPFERLGCQHLAERGPDRGQGQCVPGKCAADTSGVGILVRNHGACLGCDLGGHAVGGGGDPAADGLADDQHVRVVSAERGHAAGSGADRMGLVVDQDRPVTAGDLPDAFEVTGFRQHDPDVGQGRFDEERGDPSIGEGPIECLEVIEWNHPGRQRWVNLRSDAPASRDH